MIIPIIQARMGSTRFPGKVLVDIMGKPMLERVISRVRQANLPDPVVATTALVRDDPIAILCMTLGIRCYRGSEHDVLSRYIETAEWVGTDVVVRITADCPLVAPGLIDLVVAAYVDCDYASNTLIPSFPWGLDVEVVSLAALKLAHAATTEAQHREHVTAYIRQHPDQFTLVSVACENDLSYLHWTVDQPGDLAFPIAVYEHFGHDHFTTEEILDFLLCCA